MFRKAKISLENKTKEVFTMKKILTIALAASLILTFAGCSNGANSGNSSSSSSSSSKSDNNSSSKSDSSSTADKPDVKPDESKSVSPEEVEKAIAKALGEGYQSTVDVPKDEMFSSVMSGIDLSQIESYVVKQAVVSSVTPDTVAVMKCKSGYADTAVKLLNERYAQTLSYSRLYTFSVPKVEGARLYKFDDTVIFVIGGASAYETAAEDEAKLAVSEYEKIDNAIKSLFGNLPENLAVVTEPDENNNSGGFIIDESDSDLPIIGG